MGRFVGFGGGDDEDGEASRDAAARGAVSSPQSRVSRSIEENITRQEGTLTIRNESNQEADLSTPAGVNKFAGLNLVNTGAL